MMKKCLVIGIAIIFLISGTGYGSEKVIGTQNTETIQGIFWKKCETLREVVGGIAIFLVLIYVSAECWSRRSSIKFSTSFNFW
jgi:ABC-type spermidine/putrescine transport system permease subunit I